MFGIYHQTSKTSGTLVEDAMIDHSDVIGVTPGYNGLGKYPDSKVHRASMGPTWGRQDPGGPHVGHMDLAIRGQLQGETRKIYVLEFGASYIRGLTVHSWLFLTAVKQYIINYLAIHW